MIPPFFRLFCITSGSSSEAFKAILKLFCPEFCESRLVVFEQDLVLDLADLP